MGWGRARSSCVAVPFVQASNRRGLPAAPLPRRCRGHSRRRPLVCRAVDQTSCGRGDTLPPPPSPKSTPAVALAPAPALCVALWCDEARPLGDAGSRRGGSACRVTTRVESPGHAGPVRGQARGTTMRPGQKVGALSVVYHIGGAEAGRPPRAGSPAGDRPTSKGTIETVSRMWMELSRSQMWQTCGTQRFAPPRPTCAPGEDGAGGQTRGWGSKGNPDSQSLAQDAVRRPGRCREQSRGGGESGMDLPEGSGHDKGPMTRWATPRQSAGPLGLKRPRRTLLLAPALLNRAAHDTLSGVGRKFVLARIRQGQDQALPGLSLLLSSTTLTSHIQHSPGAAMCRLWLRATCSEISELSL